jgi:predicted deacylase
VDPELLGVDEGTGHPGLVAGQGNNLERGIGDTHGLIRRFLWLRCEDEGWWEPAVRPGTAVAEGQLLGTVSSLDGARVLQTITAPVAGVPMFVTSSPAVAADGLLLGLGAS